MGEIINNTEILYKRDIRKGRTYYWTLCLNCYGESERRLDQIKISKGLCKYCKDSTKKGIIQSVINNLYRSYKNSAHNKKLEFNLSVEEFKKIIEKDCYYCGNLPVETDTSKLRNFSGEKYLHNGIDRVDSFDGYTIDNSVPCCSMCNYMKRNYIKLDFLNHIKRIYEFNNKKEEG